MHHYHNNNKELDGSGSNSSIRPESSTATWYDSGNEEEGTATSSRPNQQRLSVLPQRTPMLWTLTGSTSCQVNKQSIWRTANVSSATKWDAICPSTPDILEEEDLLKRGQDLHGEQKPGKLKQTTGHQFHETERNLYQSSPQPLGKLLPQ